MSKSVHIALDQDAYETFRDATNIIGKAGIRVPTSQLVETLVNAEMKRLSARKVAHRFLKSIVQQVSGLPARLADEEEEDEDSDDALPNFPALPSQVPKV
jgi:hypothetical protein